MKKILLTLLISLPIFILGACTNEETEKIVTTNYTTYTFTKAIVKDYIKVSMLTPIGSDYHDYEPTSQDIVNIKMAETFIYLGFDYETWLVGEANLKNILNEKAKSISLSSFNHEEHDHEHDDHNHASHFWTNPDKAIHIIEHLRDELIKIYPVYTNHFTDNAKLFTDKLEKTITVFKTHLVNYKNPEIYYLGHNSMKEFGEFFNININSINQNMNPSAELTSAELTEFINKIKQSNTKYLFTEEAINPTTIERLKKEIDGIVIFELNAYHQINQNDFDSKVNYYDLLNRNIKHIKEALDNAKNSN